MIQPRSWLVFLIAFGSIVASADERVLTGAYAKSVVQNLSCKQGSIIALCLDSIASNPAYEDLGWRIFTDNQGFIVEKTIQPLSRINPDIYRWRVYYNGIIESLSKEAMMLTIVPTVESKPEAAAPARAEKPEQQPESGPAAISRKPEMSRDQAELIVKKLPCKQGGTVERCLRNMVSLSAAKDFGWRSYRNSRNGYIVEKKILERGFKAVTVSRWEVKLDGYVEALTNPAVKLTGKHPAGR